MKFQTDKEGSNFEKPHIEEGLHIGELTEVKDIKDGEHGKRVAFIYKIVEKDVSLPLTCYSKNKATPQNKLVQTLIAHGLDLGSEIDTDALIGSKVRVLVEDYETVVDSESITASAISKVKTLAEKPEA